MLLEAVHIPARCLAAGIAPARSFHLTFNDGRVDSLVPSDAAANSILLPAFVDAHVHLDKNYSVRKTGAACGDLFTAIGMIQAVFRDATPDDYEARMEQALQDAWRSGTRALRTHIDWMQAEPPMARAVVERLAQAWADRVQLQWSALTPLDILCEPGVGAAIAAQVAARGGLMGAFVYRNEGLRAKLEQVFALAQQHGLALDFHVDEGLDVDATALADIADLTIAFGMQGRVVCGHACSLSVQDAVQAQATLARCAQAGIHLVALPTTNLYLQGAWTATPVERGITRVLEARAAGVSLSLATDNVQDAFYPYGNYDLLATWGLGVQVAHLAPPLDWLDTITTAPAAALGLAWDGRIAPGCPADLVQLHQADEYALVGAGTVARTVIRAGQVI